MYTAVFFPDPSRDQSGFATFEEALEHIGSFVPEDEFGEDLGIEDVFYTPSGAEWGVCLTEEYNRVQGIADLMVSCGFTRISVKDPSLN